MFFSLDRPVTKNQILNTKHLPTFFCSHFNLKREYLGLPGPSLFELKRQQKISEDIFGV